MSLTYNTLHSSQPSYLLQLFTIPPLRSTLSSSTPFCHLVTQIFQSLHSRSCLASLEQSPASIVTNIWPILRAHSKLSSCHLSTALSLQTENTALLQILSWIVIHRLPHTSLPVSTPSTIYHSRLIVCLPDSVDLYRCLSILFWLSACE